MSDGDAPTGKDGDAGPTRVAIACQGGGSHTAFTAGVLMGLLREWNDEFELVGISGTSGGAFNALATWYGLVTADEAGAIDLLDALWDDLATEGFTDRLANQWVVGLSRLASSGLPVPEVSPYQLPGSAQGKAEIRDTLERYIDVDAVPDLCRRDAPELVVGTVNINAGIFETFTNEDVTPEAVLASAAVPNLFEAVEIDGHYHWDGLNQELRTIERVNQWIDAGHLPESDFTKTVVRRIPMGRAYHCSTKFDRSPAFLEELIDLGERRAEEFYVGR